MQRDLLIPYAINQRTGDTLSAEALEEQMADWRDTVRLDATLDQETTARRATHYRCPACGQLVYPHAPFTPDGRHFWAHRPKSSENCPLAFGRPLSPDQINRLIFAGRQEGEAHKNLVALLNRLALADPNTVKDTLKTGQYEKPTPEMAAEFPFGRFPDVSFTYGGEQAVLEAQLATISLYGINGRRAFYDRHGSTLLWVARSFDPAVQLRASTRDILADQDGVLLSLDTEALETSAATGVFHLRAWLYALKDGAVAWQSRVLPLSEVIKIARKRPWSEDFKRRFIEAYDGKNYVYDDVPDPLPFLNEALRKLDIPEYEKWDAESSNMLAILRLLISLEVGRPIGTRHPNIVSIANTFDVNGGHRHRSLVLKAIEYWQPELLKRDSVQTALRRSEQKLKDNHEAALGRNSVIGHLRDLLFPKWKLAPADGRAGRDLTARPR
jgi:hypothetical protein